MCFQGLAAWQDRLAVLSVYSEPSYLSYLMGSIGRVPPRVYFFDSKENSMTTLVRGFVKPEYQTRHVQQQQIVNQVWARFN